MTEAVISGLKDPYNIDTAHRKNIRERVLSWMFFVSEKNSGSLLPMVLL